jgi:threonine/homoserine/homoserine lactone efflux protein
MLHYGIFDPARFFIFLGAALLLAVAPGPGMLYVLARTLAGGRREGLLSAFGTFFGGMVHVFAAAAGISIILAKSAVAFATVKYLGAAYLCFLGIRMIVDSRNDSRNDSTKDARKFESTELDSTKKVEGLVVIGLPRARNPFWQGVMTEVLNPKTALFFLSFIPQFVDRNNGHVFLQFVLLGTLSVALNTSADIIVTLVAGPLGQRIRESARFRRRQRTLTGAVMIGLGTYLALGESK